jgi:hypothetical protein
VVILSSSVEILKICSIISHDACLHKQTKKQTPWPESASELYRPSDCRLSAKLVPTFAGRGSHVMSMTDPYGRILDFLDRRLLSQPHQSIIHNVLHFHSKESTKRNKAPLNNPKTNYIFVTRELQGSKYAERNSNIYRVPPAFPLWTNLKSRDAFTGDYYILESKRVNITYSADKRMTVPFLCQLSLSPTVITESLAKGISHLTKCSKCVSSMWRDNWLPDPRIISLVTF